MNTLQQMMAFEHKLPKEPVPMEAAGALAELVDQLRGRATDMEIAQLIGVGAVVCRYARLVIEAEGGIEAVRAKLDRDEAQV